MGSRSNKSAKITDDVLHFAEISNLKTERDNWKSKFEDVARQLAKVHQWEDMVLKLKDDFGDFEPRPIIIKQTRRTHEATAVGICSDWHIEELVEPEKVQYKNCYNLKIAERRANRCFESFIKLVRMARHNNKIDTFVLALLGDFISGHIHDELKETCKLPPSRALIKSCELLSAGIDLLLKEGDFKEIVIVCTADNHGRTTEKPRISTRNEHSFTMLGYWFLKEKYKDEKRIKWIIADGYFANLQIYNWKHRFHHGDGIKYQGGIGGIHIPLNKAIAQWNKAEVADHDWLGHWHSRYTSRHYCVNASLIGYSPLSIIYKTDFEPPAQSFALISPTRGKTIECPVFVEEGIIHAR